MTAHPTDDELRAMLEARAGAVSPGAAREALAGARAAIAGPTADHGAGVAFHPRPVAVVRRRSRTPWGIAAVAAAAVVAVALLGSRVQPDRPAASAPAVIAGASQGPAGSDRAVLVGDITVDELRSRLAAGELDGRTVVVPGRLLLVQGRCLAECTFVQIDGLPDVFIDKGDRTSEATEAAIDRFGMSAPAVFSGSDGRLRLIGWLVDGADAPLQADDLPDFRDRIPGGLVAATGWVHPGGAIKRFTTTSDPATSGTYDAASGRPSRAESVSVQIPLWAAGDTAPVAGTFLLRPPTSPDRLGLPTYWDLVARFDPQSTVWVQQPRTELDGPTIPAADLMTALGDGSLDGQVFAIDAELKDVVWECPLDARPCHRFYVDGLPGVAVTWDGGLLGSDGSPDAPVSVMSGRLLVTPRNGSLRLLGVLDGDLSRPVGVDALAEMDPSQVHDPLSLRAVDGWLVVDGVIYCALQRPGAATACPPARSLLTPSEPSSSGVLTSPQNVNVTLHRGTPGLGGLPIRQAGPFLVRYGVVAGTCDTVSTGDATCLGGPRGGWIVEAAYGPASVRVVTFP